jgi:hypothetical protein
LLLGIAIPGRTARHVKAAVSTTWTPRSPDGDEKFMQLCEFRKNEQRWRLAGTLERDAR